MDDPSRANAKCADLMPSNLRAVMAVEVLNNQGYSWPHLVDISQPLSSVTLSQRNYGGMGEHGCPGHSMDSLVITANIVLAATVCSTWQMLSLIWYHLFKKDNHLATSWFWQAIFTWMKPLSYLLRLTNILDMDLCCIFWMPWPVSLSTGYSVIVRDFA